MTKFTFAEKKIMAWLWFGVIYTLAYLLVDWLVPDGAVGEVWLRTVALGIPPALVIGAIVRRRSRWVGCQWVFWSTVAIGLVVSTVGFLGWTVDGLLAAREASSLEWHAVLALFGVVAPLLALLAQPHLGTRERAAATTAVDIAGIAVFAGFLFSYVVLGLTLTPGVTQSAPLSFLLLSELLQLLVLTGLLAAAGVARGTGWDTRRTAASRWARSSNSSHAVCRMPKSGWGPIRTSSSMTIPS